MDDTPNQPNEDFWKPVSLKSRRIAENIQFYLSHDCGFDVTNGQAKFVGETLDREFARSDEGTELELERWKKRSLEEKLHRIQRAFKILVEELK